MLPGAGLCALGKLRAGGGLCGADLSGANFDTDAAVVPDGAPHNGEALRLAVLPGAQPVLLTSTDASKDVENRCERN